MCVCDGEQRRCRDTEDFLPLLLQHSPSAPHPLTSACEAPGSLLSAHQKERKRNSPSLQRTHIPKPPGNMLMEGQVTFRDISRELKPQSSSFPAATTQDLLVSGKPHPACRFGDKPSPLLHLISFPVNYVFIIYSRALLLVTSCCLLLLRAGHVSGSARHSGGLQGWTTGMWWTKTIWDKMKKLVCHWGSHSH